MDNLLNIGTKNYIIKTYLLNRGHYMKIIKRNIFVLGICTVISIGIIGCNNVNNKSASTVKKEVTQNYKGYSGIGYEPIYHISKNEYMEKGIEKTKRSYEGEYNYDLLENLNENSSLSLEKYSETLDAIFGKFIYTYTSQYKIEETKLEKEFIEMIINKLITLQEIGKKSDYKEKVAKLNPYFNATIDAMTELKNNLDIKEYAEYLDYKGRARLTLQTLISTCSNGVILGYSLYDDFNYKPEKFDSINFQIEQEIYSIRDYMGSISLVDESLRDEDYIVAIKRLEKIQKTINENFADNLELDNINKQFNIVYDEIDKARNITRDNYEKAAKQKGTNGECIVAIRGADIDLAPKMIKLATMISDNIAYDKINL